MNYEEEYKEALGRAKKLRDSKYQTMNAKRVVEEIFPQLAESEDERIRRKMIEHFKAKTKETWCNMPVKDIIDYLERQKEQKLTEWSEEDESQLDDIEKAISNYYDYDLNHAPQYHYWLEEKLKSLRPQPKAELTLLDENIIEAAVAFVEQNDHFNVWRGIDKHTVIEALRSLQAKSALNHSLK